MCTNASAQSVFSQIVEDAKNHWDKSVDSDIYLPLYTWHNRYVYTSEKIATFNENPWGLGYGKSYIDEKQNWHGFYAMAFSDSHSKFEPIVGYGHTKNWYKNDFFVGAGYTLFITSRSDINHYMPIPGALPLLSVGYKKFSITGTYLPGGKGNGNIAFFWSRFSF